MKREIRFRLWVEYSQKYYKDSEIYLHDDFDSHETLKDLFASGTWEQFTGLTDKNGVDIYDSDIIENCDTKDLQVVYWNKDKAAWYCRYVYDKTRIVSLADSIGNLNTVIGNIHKHKTLLK